MNFNNESQLIAELMPLIGKEFCDNHSSTHRSQLVLIAPTPGGWIALTREVPGEYSSSEPRPGFSRQPLWLVSNGFFGV